MKATLLSSKNAYSRWGGSSLSSTSGRGGGGSLFKRFPLESDGPPQDPDKLGSTSDEVGSSSRAQNDLLLSIKRKSLSPKGVRGWRSSKKQHDQNNGMDCHSRSF
ncbi:hypothetical protein Tco_0806687 [Tanacetum coccineum]